jgi:hypothetical protein
MDSPALGKWIVLLGLGIAAVGVIVWILAKTGIPFGSLPGDIRYERPGFSFSFPIVTSIVLSIVITIILNVVLWFFRKH